MIKKYLITGDLVENDFSNPESEYPVSVSAVSQKVSGELSQKLDLNQGIDKVGKYARVGTDGTIIFENINGQEQSNWGEQNSEKVEFIRGKPFQSIGSGLLVSESGVLSSQISTITINGTTLSPSGDGTITFPLASSHIAGMVYSPHVCKTLYVSPNGNDTNGDGSEQKPYYSISKCVNNSAYPYLKVVVLEGEYNYSSRTIVGENKFVILSYIGNTTINMMNTSGFIHVGRGSKLVLMTPYKSEDMEHHFITINSQNTEAEISNYIVYSDGGLVSFEGNPASYIFNGIYGMVFTGRQRGGGLYSYNNIELVFNTENNAIRLFSPSTVLLDTVKANIKHVVIEAQPSASVISIGNLSNSDVGALYNLSKNSVIAIGGKWINQE